MLDKRNLDLVSLPALPFYIILHHKLYVGLWEQELHPSAQLTQDAAYVS